MVRQGNVPEAKKRQRHEHRYLREEHEQTRRRPQALDEYINVWGRFTFLLPFALVTCWLTG